MSDAKMMKLLIASFLYCVSVYCYSATLMVQVDFTDDDHQVVNAWLVAQDLPANFHIKGQNNDIKFDLLDDKNNLISSSYANRPAPVYGAYILATAQEKKQLQLNAIPKDKGSYYLRIPQYQNNMQAIQLSYQSSKKQRSASKTSVATPSTRIVNKAYSLASLRNK